MQTRFLIPPKLNGNNEGYSEIAYIAQQIKKLKNQNIIIDFTNCTFIQGNLCAAIGAIITELKIHGNNVFVSNIRNEIKGILERNEFLNFFHSSNKSFDDRNTCIPYRIFTKEDEEIATQFFLHQIFEKPRMPIMTPKVKKKVIRNIFEICINAVTHSGCNEVHCCGQVFRGNLKKAIVTFVDMGFTIKHNVNQHLNQQLDGAESILWAMKEGNTTKGGNTPGGLGLDEVYQLISLNNGKMQIISADGFVEILGESKKKHYIGSNFPGTIVSIEILLDDRNTYMLQSEKDNQIIEF